MLINSEDSKLILTGTILNENTLCINDDKMNKNCMLLNLIKTDLTFKKRGELLSKITKNKIDSSIGYLFYGSEINSCTIEDLEVSENIFSNLVTLIYIKSSTAIKFNRISILKNILNGNGDGTPSLLI